MPWVDLAGHLSFVLTATSFLLRDMLLLRSVAIASGLVGMVYNHQVPGGPLWLVIFWLGVFIVINLFQIGMIFAARRGVDLSPEERELRETLLAALSPVEMMKLVRAGRWRDVPVGHRFTEQDQGMDELVLLYSGEVAILRDGEEIARSRDGTFIGEMSFVAEKPATATVKAIRDCRVLAWSQDALRGLLRRNPSIHLSLQAVFSNDLADKLKQRGGWGSRTEAPGP